MSIVRTTDGIRSGRLTRVEVANTSLARIEAVNGHINAIVKLADDIHERALSRGAATIGPLAGVTFTVKDTIAVQGLPATAGSRALAEWIPAWTAPAVERLQDAGAVLIGKSNCPEFAFDLHTTNDLFGSTINPLDAKVTIGGSSGGDAAAVASGMVSFGIGTDLGGSIRWPAACAGLVGLRPTVGIVPSAGQHPMSNTDHAESPSIVSFADQSQTISPIAATTDDVWRVFDVLAGPREGDPENGGGVVPDPTAVELAGLSIGWMSGQEVFPLRHDVSVAIASAIERLKHQVREVLTVSGAWLPDAVQSFKRLRSLEGFDGILSVVTGKEHLLGTRIQAGIESHRSQPPLVHDYLAAGRKQAQLRAVVLALLRTTPVMVLPVAPVTAFSPTTTQLALGESVIFADNAIDLCRAITMIGIPAVSVPCGTGNDGLPVSVQVIARPYREHEALAVAAAIEQTSEWRGSTL